MLTKFRKNIICYSALILVALLLILPVVYMLANSFMTSGEVMRTYDAIINGGTQVSSYQKKVGFKLIPEMVSFMQYYNVLLRKPKYLLMFWNSVMLTVPVVAGQIFVSSLAAFAFGKLKFPLRNKIFFVYIIVMLMPFQVTLVPNYIMLDKLKLLGSYWSIILPGTFSTFGVFLLRQFMMYIPNEYFEAAKIDGVGYIGMFFKIMLPQCKGAMASLAILVFVDNWNMVEQPLIFLKNENMHPLSIFLAKINNNDMGIAFACGFLYMLPALLIFLYGENHFVEGIQLSGIK